MIVNTLVVGGVLAFIILGQGASGGHPPDANASHSGAKDTHEGEDPNGGGQDPGSDESRGDGDDPGAGHSIRGMVGPTLQLQNFVVQLKAVETERYAHIAIELEVTRDGDKALIKRQLPRIRDVIIGYLADRTADELRGSAGMRQLKEDLMAMINDVVPRRPVVGVYVTDFIVQ